jgi:hypothetical protein
MSTETLPDVAGHEWKAAAAIDVTADQIHPTETGYGPVTVEPGAVVPLDVYCGRCRRPWTDASGQPCLRTVPTLPPTHRRTRAARAWMFWRR